MTVYFIAQITIDDRDEYARYEAGFGEPFAKYGGSLLSVSEDPTLIEGDWPFTRTVLLSFDSREQAMAWYDSPEYQSIIGHRHGASQANIVLVDQYES